MGSVAQNQRALPAPRDVHTQVVRIMFMHGVMQVVSVSGSHSRLPPRTPSGHAPGFVPASVPAPASRVQGIRVHANSIVFVPGGSTHVQKVDMPAGPQSV